MITEIVKLFDLFDVSDGEDVSVDFKIDQKGGYVGIFVDISVGTIFAPSDMLPIVDLSHKIEKYLMKIGFFIDKPFLIETENENIHLFSTFYFDEEANTQNKNTDKNVDFYKDKKNCKFDENDRLISYIDSLGVEHRHAHAHAYDEDGHKTYL